MIRLIGYMIGLALLVWAVMIIAGYAVLVACVGGVWALVEVNARNKGRPYILPKQRFLVVWTRALSPVDPKHWVTAEQQPATDPYLLPGRVTGDLRVEDRGIERIDEPGPLERFTVRIRLHNHSTETLRLNDLDDVDLQLWTPTGKVVGTDTTWSVVDLAPRYSCDVDVAVTVVDEQPIAFWAVAHRPAGDYAFFPATGLPQAPRGA